MHRPDIGYVQGMSYIAAILLVYMDEHPAFVTFCNMVTKFPIMPFYSFNDPHVRKILQLFKQVFQHNLPELCEHLETENIMPKQYVYEWFMTLFTRALKVELVSRVLDLYFLDGIFVLYQTAIGKF
jgi:TBC1 domain family member 14